MKKNNIKLKKYFISAMYLCLVAFLTYCLAINIKFSVNDLNTWQNHASYDFETYFEIDENGEEKLVCEVSNASQLAGAVLAINPNMGASNNRIIVNDGGGGGSSIGSGTGSGTSTPTPSTKPQKDISSYFNATTIKLTKNIDLGEYKWKAIDFSGNFDGGSHIIYNLTCEDVVTSSNNYNTAGFIATLTGSLKNVYFQNVKITNKATSLTSATGIVGYNKGTIENVNITSGTITANAYISGYDRYVGGIAGYNNSTITKCSNNATITKGSYIGGITGYSTKVITKCYNFGNVYSDTTERDTYVGGIVGNARMKVTLCTNSGSVTSYSKGTAKCYAGGISGYNLFSVEECQNDGEICAGSSSDSDTSYAGGISGYSVDNIKYCVNKGKVKSYAKSTTKNEYTVNTNVEKLFADGVGYFWAYKIYIISGDKDYKGSGNYSGKVYTSKKYQTGRFAYCGGITGFCGDSYEIYDCYSTGDVVTSSDRGIYQVYDLYFKWKANNEYHLLIHNTSKYQCNDYCGPITGCGGKVNGCLYSKSVSEINYSFNFSQTVENGSKSQSCSLSGWTKHNEGDWGKNNHDYGWYLEDMGGASYNTFHCVDATSCSEIKLTAHYTSQYLSKSLTTYYTINTELSSTKKVEKGTYMTDSNIKKYSDLDSSYFGFDNANKNSGYPYIKNLYY